MKIKRTFAKDIRQAMKKVREEQGPDAVILANRKVDGGVEIVSAVDYDEEMVYQQAKRQEAEQKKVAPAPRSPVEQYQQISAKQHQAKVHPAPASFSQAMQQARQQPVDIASDWVKTAQAPIPHQTRVNQAYTQQDFDIALTESEEERKQQAKEERANKIAKLEQQRELARKKALAQKKRAQRQAQIKKKQQHQQSADLALIKDMKKEISFLRDMMENQMNILEWDKVAKRHPIRVALLNELFELGLGNDVAQEIVDQIPETKDLIRSRRLALGILAKKIPISDDDIINFGGVIAVVGATGVGKTTTIAKLAARFAMKHGNRHVALVTTDSYRIGAHEQLLNYSRILGVPLHVAQDNDDLARILAGLVDKRLVLIDTAGMSQRDLRLTEQFQKLQEASVLIRPYLVLSASTQLASLNETVKAFEHVDLAGCIITKLDEAATLGGVLTSVIKSQLPVAYLTDGQKVPEDLQTASAQRLVSLAVPLGHKNGEELATDTMAMQFLNMNRLVNG